MSSQVKEANLTMLYTARFQLYDILEKGKTIKTAKISMVARGFGEGG